jgi:hypothetical protein
MLIPVAVLAADRDEFRRTIMEESTSEVLVLKGQVGAGHLEEAYDGTASGGTLVYRLSLVGSIAQLEAIHAIYLNYTTDGGVGDGDAIFGLTEVSDNPGTPVANMGLMFAKDNDGETQLYWISDAGTVYTILLGGVTIGTVVDSLSIFYTAPSTAASIFSALDIQLDVTSLVATSEIHGVNVAAVGSTSGIITGLGTHTGVMPIHQHIGAFTTPSQTEYAGEIPSGGSWSDGIDGNTIFEADNDEIYIGSAAVFGELEVILSTPSSHNQNLVFEFYDTTPAWVAFTPLDGTNGMQQNGIIEWTAANLTNWKSDGDPAGVDGSSGYWMRARRERNNVTTDPIVTTIKTLAPTEYEWDKNGDVDVHSVNIAAGEDYSIDGTPLDLDDIDDGSTYERVAAAELAAGIYKDGDDDGTTKGIAAYNNTDFDVDAGVVTLATKTLKLPFEFVLGSHDDTDANLGDVDPRQGFDATNMHHYQRRATMTGLTNEVSYWWAKVLLPTNFTGFPASNNAHVNVRASDETNNTLTIAAYDDEANLDSGCNSAHSFVADDTWELWEDEITDSYDAGDWVYFKYTVNLDGDDTFDIAEGWIDVEVE